MSKVVELHTPAKSSEVEALWDEQERLIACKREIDKKLNFIDRKLSAYYLPKERG